ncbi:MAG: hypothetical protein ACRDF0_12065 [Candidatus Limnocylindria bacterium]
MPFLRVIRDKRGYETTYLMHWYREGNRQRSRILYVFRTPGGVRVGRDGFEPEILRQIESSNPDVTFDWQAVMSNRQVIEPTLEARRRRLRRDDAPAGSEADPQDPQDSSGAAGASRKPPEPQKPDPPRPAIPASIEGATPDEQVAFLAHWYPIVRERILRRTSDPSRQEALFALAERLNPAAWTDADEITTGLQQAAETLERFSYVFAKRRRRPRRRPVARTPEPEPQPPDA